MPDQSPDSIFMVRPAKPGFNLETSTSNSFQTEQSDSDQEEIRSKILEEFDRMVDLLSSHDIDVQVFHDTDVPVKPDAHFPNNWISIHPDGKVVLYPMEALNRRAERQQSIVDALSFSHEVREVIDLSFEEVNGKYLEGTGSLVFDYSNAVAYACRSPRTNEDLVKSLCLKLGFKPIIFDAVDERGKPIYHTNVMMCVGSKFATLCLDAVKDDEQQEILLENLSGTNHKIVAISYDQVYAFAGNMIEIKSRSGEPFVVLSERAFNSLLPGQIDAISRHAEMLPIPVPTIEDAGGGSVRCMITGIYLPKRP